MKCNSCGANLQIDNAFCPYCGAPNKVAKKHREDMKRYENDYKATKEEVIGNSKRFNQRTFKITAIAVTIAVLAIVLPLLPLADRFGYERVKHEGKKKAEQSIEILEYYIDNDDYLGYYTYIEENGLYFEYNSKAYPYAAPRNMADSFANLVRFSFDINGNASPKDVTIRTENIAMYVNHIYNGNKRISADALEKVRTFADHMCRDTGLLLNTYYGIPMEVIEEFPDMSDAQRSVAVEEGLKNVK